MSDPSQYPDWPELLRWLTVLKDRVETLPSISTEQIITGVGALTTVDDINLTATLGGTPATALLQDVSITLGWVGTLAADRLNANVVQGVVNDTNVTGSIASQVLTLGWTGTLGVARGGTNLASYAVGDLLYASGTTTLAKLADVAVGSYLRSGGVTTAPLWSTLTLPNAANSGDLLVASGANTMGAQAPAALTKTNDTNVTLTLGGSAATALVNAASLTLGWTGSLSVARGGTGTASAFTAGSVVFAGASGVYSQDNANLFWDVSTHQLGIGTTTPGRRVEIKNASGSSQSLTLANNDFINGSVGTFLQFASGATSGSTYYHIQSWNGGGTGQAPLVLQQFGGGVGIVKTTPTAALHIGAGSAAANTAPLKLTSGALLTTAEAGAVEFLTDKFFGTITTGAARKTFAFLEGPAFTASVTIEGMRIGLGPGAITSNTVFGTNALNSNVSGSENIAIGNFTLTALISNSDNVAIGFAAAQFNTGSRNIAIGNRVLNAAGAGPDNIGIGDSVLRLITSGQQNVCVGSNTGGIITSGQANMLLGYNAGASLTTTSYNTMIGRSAGQNATGSGNVFIGSGVGGADGAGFKSTGDQNTFLGVSAGNIVTSGNYNVIIGAYTGTIVDTNSNRIVLSDGQGNIVAYADNNKSWALGGGTSPTARLHLPAGTATANTAPLKFTSGTNLTTAEAGALEFTTDDYFATITTGAARKAFVLDDGARLTSGKIPIATTNGRLIDGPTPLAGTKVYYVSDTSGGAVTRKLTFVSGILTAET